MNTKFPKHKAGLRISHNEHKIYYQSIEQYIKDNEIDDSDWISLEEKQKAINTDSMWCIHVYPNTPIGFYTWYASDFDTLLNYVNSKK